MPRLYLTPVDLESTSLGMAPQIAMQLQQLPFGALDKMLMRASQRVDSYCQRRIQAPGSTTLLSNALAGTSTLLVASTLTVDSLAENAVQLGTESVLIQPGGVSVSSYAAPYPGTITLATPLQYNHSLGDTVTYLYKEVTEAGGASTSDPYTEALNSQSSQIALAHMPPMSMAMTRVVFLNNYPIIAISGIEHAFSYTNEFASVPLTIESLEPTQGWYRFNVGSVIMREGLMRTTYTGGYQVVPDDIKVATSYYFAEQVTQMLNPLGLQQITLGKRTQRWDTSKKSTLLRQAEECLKYYRRTI